MKIQILSAATVLTILLGLGTMASAADELGWKRHVALGYSTANGNTKNSSLTLDGSFVKKMEGAVFSNDSNLTYGESKGDMETQKWSNKTRYSYDFGDSKDWFNSYQLLVDHDYFGDIDYRILPSVGIGYWWSRTDDWTFSTESGLAYEITEYRSTAPSKESMAAFGRAFMKKQIFDKAFISEDFTVYPSLEGEGLTLKSITEFTNPLSENMDFSAKFVFDYNSEPSAGSKKSDTLFITGLKYSF